MTNLLARASTIARPIPVRGAAARMAPPALVAGGRGVAAAAAPATSYTHLYGSGDRTALITVTASFAPDGGALNNLVDGGLTANTTDGIDMPGTGATSADGAWIRFDCLVPIYMDELEVLFDSGVPPTMGGPWLARGSNDGANWVNHGGKNWDAASVVVPLSGVPVTGWKSWLWQNFGTGTVFTNSYALEFKFKSADAVAA